MTAPARPKNPMALLLITAGLIEMAIAIAAFMFDGPNALIAALIGTGLALGAQIIAVAALRPAMGGTQAQFQQKWVVGMAVRFASFLMLAALMFVLKDRLPITWMAGGYLGMLLVLLFAETRFLT